MASLPPYLADIQREIEGYGRAYGLELIARRRLGHRLFGWVTYTLARAERDFPDVGWRPADFDQPQIVNGDDAHPIADFGCSIFADCLP